MKTISLYRSELVALVDDEDYPWLMEMRWHRGPKGSAAHSEKIYGDTAILLMHRVVMNAPLHLQVDHWNRNKLDNQKSNLRLATNQQNQYNIPKFRGGTSKYKGVSWNTQSQWWRAEIGRVKSSRRYLGHFNNEIEAAKAYNDAAKSMFGAFAILNPV